MSETIEDFKEKISPGDSFPGNHPLMLANFPRGSSMEEYVHMHIRGYDTGAISDCFESIQITVTDTMDSI